MSLDKANTDPSQLTEGSGINVDDLKPREFFWDSIILYLVSVILALSAIDALTEFIRGTGVSCITSEGLEEGQREYINSYCAGSLPITEYIPAFIFIHGLAISIPHFLWLATYGGQFDYFFSVVKRLEHFRDEATGRYPKLNIDLVRQLEHSFTTYGQNSVYWLYIGKLCLQLVFAVASLVLAVFYFTDFEVYFRCPRDNNTADEFWPLSTDVTCVFTSLKLLFWIRIADVVLICLIVCCVMWGFWFCASGHPTELGSDEVARFSFQSGIQPIFYVSHCWYSPRILSSFLVRFFTLPFTSPRVSTDLDFMLLKLFRTNSGFGKVVKDIQIELRTLNMVEQDRLAVSLFERKWNSGIDVDLPEDDLKWNFDSSPVMIFESPPEVGTSCLQVPYSVRGAIVALSTLSKGTGALSVTFSAAGHGLALSRLFERTADIVFTDHKKGAEVDTDLPPEDTVKKIVEVVKNTTSHITITLPEDLLVSREEYSSEFYKQIQPVWTDICDNEDYCKTTKTSFLVVGPMNEDQSTIINLFLNQICSDEFQLKDGCVIVLLRPIRIAGKATSNEFYGLQRRNSKSKTCPRQIVPPNCTPLDIDIIVSKQELSWPSDLNPSDSQQQRATPTRGKSTPKQQSPTGTTLDEASDEQEMVVVIPGSSVHDNTAKGSSNVTDKGAVPSQVHLLCGDIDTCFEVCIYKFQYLDEWKDTDDEDEEEEEKGEKGKGEEGKGEERKGEGDESMKGVEDLLPKVQNKDRETTTTVLTQV